MKHPVRRKDREITDPGELDEILEKGVFGVLAMCGEEGPYAVPMNYVSRPGAVYFHCAAEGLKLDILRQNPRGCFSVVLNTDYARPDNPDRSCGWGMFYESVTVWGPVVFVESRDEKKLSLTELVEKSSGEKFGGSFSGQDLDRVTVFRLDVEGRSGKARRP